MFVSALSPELLSQVVGLGGGREEGGEGATPNICFDGGGEGEKEAPFLASLLGAVDPQKSFQRGLLGPVWGGGTCQAAPDTTTFLPTCLPGSVKLRGWQEGGVQPEGCLWSCLGDVGKLKSPCASPLGQNKMGPWKCPLTIRASGARDPQVHSQVPALPPSFPHKINPWASSTGALIGAPEPAPPTRAA